MLFEARFTDSGIISDDPKPTWVQVDEAAVCIDGDPLNYRECYVHAHGDTIRASNSLAQLANAMRSASIPVQPSATK